MLGLSFFSTALKSVQVVDLDELGLEEGLEGCAVLSKLVDTLVELVERHRILE